MLIVLRMFDIPQLEISHQHLEFLLVRCDPTDVWHFVMHYSILLSLTNDTFVASVNDHNDVTELFYKWRHDHEPFNKFTLCKTGGMIIK